MLGLVPECLQQIAAYQFLGAASVRFRWRQRFALASLVKEARHAGGLWVHFQAHHVVFERVARCFDLRRCGRWAGRGADIESAIAQARRAGFQQQANAMRYRIIAKNLRRHSLSRGVHNFHGRRCSRKLYRSLYDLAARPRQRVEHDHGSSRAARTDVRRNFRQRSVKNSVAHALDVFEVALGVEIVHRNARTWKNVVEVIK